MAVIQEKYLESTGGIRKNIDKDSMPLALDILQRGLYAFPVQSTIRELASNARDAIVERDVARAILSGKDEIEDHFDVEKVNGIYHSSGWDPDYFDTTWLSNDKNVYIYYEEGKTKDKLRIVDNGVGLGKDRLVGYFQLNYSSKRTNKDSLGKWGLGSKVALSLNVPSFRVISRYNGKKTAFDVYLDKVDPITSPFSHGKKNDSMQLTNECRAFYEITEEKNGLEIEVEVKKHNKKQFFEAVESQLMYMPDIKFMHKELGSLSYKTIDISAKTLYKDDNVIISESTVYDKPHILLGAGEALVNYGFVAFNELEIEPKRGAVGLILDINDIEVTPSREAPVWSSKTRDAVLKKYEDVSKKAAEYINAELSTEKDYIKWLVKAAQTMGALKHGNNDSVVGRLASIIDASAITNIKFPRDTSIEFENKASIMLGDKLVARLVKYNSYTKKIERNNVTDLASLSKPIYFTKDKADMYKDRYIYENDGEFVLIQAKDGFRTDTFAKFVLNSAELQNYADKQVPEDILELYKAVEEGDEGMTEAGSSSTDPRAAMLRRKAEAKVLLHKLNRSNGDYVFSTKELPILDLPLEFTSDKVVVYGSGNDRKDLKNLARLFPANYLAQYEHKTYNVGDDQGFRCIYNPPKLIDMVVTAEENKKHLALSEKYKTPYKFVVKSYNKTTGKLVFSDDIKAVATAAVMKSLIEDSHAKYFHKENMEYLDKAIYKEYTEFTTGWTNSYRRPVRFANKTTFYRECIELSMINAGLLGGDIPELLETINDSLPGILCEDVDVVTDVDILFMEPIKKLIKDIENYKDISELLFLFSDHYFYQDDVRDKVADQIKKIIELNRKANDEILQQSDNTGSEG